MLKNLDIETNNLVCSKRTSFDTVEQAENALLKTFKLIKNDNKWCYPKLCEFCNKWHIHWIYEVSIKEENK